MGDDCIFCQIAKGKIPSMTVYEDDKCRAILDINPANPGHVLLMPKEHHVIWQLLPDDIVSRISIVSRNISKAMLSSLSAKGVNLYAANGEEAGQKAPHFIMHVIPRFKDDGLNFLWPPKKIKEDEAKTIALKLEGEISKLGAAKAEAEKPKLPEPSKKSSFSESEMKMLKKLP